MMKFCRVSLLIFLLNFVASPEKANAQLEVFLDFLIYDYGLLFGFEGEPGAHDIDFTDYPYQYDDVGMYFFPEEAGRPINTYFNFHFQTNEQEQNGAWFQLKFSPISVFTFDVNHLQLYENNFGKERTRYSFTNFSAQYNRIRNPRTHFWWSLGLTRFGGNEDEFLFLDLLFWEDPDDNYKIKK